MRILVTGSKGFIGSHLVRMLKKSNIKVTEFDIKNGNDINDFFELNWYPKNEKIDMIIHLAAISSLDKCKKNPDEALETNILGTFNVINVAKQHKIPVVVASTAAVKEPGSSLYAASKAAMENICKLYDQVRILRMYNIYGPGSKSVVNKFIKRIKEEKPIHLNGNTIRDYVYIDDVMVSLKTTITNFQSGVIELGTAQGTSLTNLVKMISKAVGKKPIILQDGPLLEIQKSFMYYDEEIDLHLAKTTLMKGIKKLI